MQSYVLRVVRCSISCTGLKFLRVQQVEIFITRPAMWAIEHLLALNTLHSVIIDGDCVYFNKCVSKVVQGWSVLVLDLRVRAVRLQLQKPELFTKPPEPRETRNTAKMKAGQNPPLFFPLLLTLHRSSSLLSPFFFSSPFPKHEQFTVNSIFPWLGSHGTALEFRFVVIKWLHGIVFLRAPPSAFIRICQCRCRSASQSARLQLLLHTPLPLPSPKLVIPYEIRRSWQTHNLITSARLKIYWIFPPCTSSALLTL